MNMEVRVSSITQVADGIKLYELAGVRDEELPPFTAGAHVEIELGVRRT